MSIGTNRYDMEASVTSPSGMTEMCEIQDLGTSQYSIKFIPKEMGIHTVSVKHRGMHIPGLLYTCSFLALPLYSFANNRRLTMLRHCFLVVHQAIRPSVHPSIITPSFVLWIVFCHTGPISLYVDIFLFICVYFVCFCFILNSCCIIVSVVGWT